MQPRKRIPSRSRKDRSIRIARNFIFASGVKWFPIDPKSLYKQYGFLLYTWDEAKKILKEKDPLRLKKTKAEARTSITRGSKLYVTVYDDKILPPERITYTLAHELGHIVLGHLDDFDKTALNRGGLTEAEYTVLEEEADFFAAELLAPIYIVKELNIAKAEALREIFSLSIKASNNKAQDLAWWGTKEIVDESQYLFRLHFKDYLQPLNICSSSSRIRTNIELIKNEEVKYMADKNFFIEVDNNNRFCKCPQCGNDVFSHDANYCKLCGFYLYNTCSNSAPNSSYIDYCNRINPGDARYCEICGEQTVLMQKGLLFTWEEIIDDEIPIKECLYAKEAAVLDADEMPKDDDYIPF